MIEGATFPMDQGVEKGLVHEVWECESHSAFMQQVMDYAHRFTRPGKASLAVGAIKRAVQTGAEVGLEQGLALERELQAQLFSSADAKEGLAAYVEKRKAAFAGK
jgi:enoyl-CoA hydratase